MVPVAAPSLVVAIMPLHVGLSKDQLKRRFGSQAKARTPGPGPRWISNWANILQSKIYTSCPGLFVCERRLTSVAGNSYRQLRAISVKYECLKTGHLAHPKEESYIVCWSGSRPPTKYDS
ncbi:hypothetical protein CIHG_06916 [Coccidioides immitis H538.4]|uniref:Uncharacterized protein n=3 Tax=Coccidioides immitis TaxID=5501 RepID=A0A0J8R490_COCIT|nr:hypothetical protein CIRG_09961 [Coccidioides immitis RMSCC 2394]KMU78548.1 hypothetical protein CISG_07208 [Coccidioides immitis RMSCC 3703]KMU89246.1 hypothetical protein CIHG_06916 [Coccidioides immitis H538.4]